MNVLGLTKKFLGIGLLCLPLTMSTTLTGCLTDDDDDDTTTPGTNTAWPANVVVSAGAQGHPTLGSALDIDAGASAVMTSAIANANQGKIDLVFLHYGGSYYLHDAVSAKAAGIANNIDLTDSYNSSEIQAVTMVKVATKPANQEAAKTAYNNSNAKVSSSVITGGEIFIVKTTAGKLSLITVGTPSGAAAGTADFTLNIGSLAP